MSKKEVKKSAKKITPKIVEPKELAEEIADLLPKANPEPAQKLAQEKPNPLSEKPLLENSDQLTMPEMEPSTPPKKRGRPKGRKTSSSKALTPLSKSSLANEGSFTKSDGMILAFAADSLLFQPALKTRPIASEKDFEKMGIEQDESELENIGRNLAEVLNKHFGDFESKEEVALAASLGAAMIPRIREARFVRSGLVEKKPAPQKKTNDVAVPRKLSDLDMVPQIDPIPDLI